MITLFPSEMAYDFPKLNPETMYFYGFWVYRIEEFNLKFSEEKTYRCYRIHWRDKGKKKCFDCVLHDYTYSRVIIPNLGKVEIMREKQREQRN